MHDPRAYESGMPAIAQWRHRGVAYWENDGDARIVWGTGDGFLVAVDAKTGLPAPDFGDNGRIDLTTGVPRATRGERDVLNLLVLSSQSPPMILRDTIVIGSTINDRTITPRGHAGLGPCLRHTDRPQQVGLPHRAPERRRVRVRHLAERVVALQRQHQHLVDDERRRGARLGLPAHRDADQRLLRRAPAWGTTCSPRASWPSTSRPASGSGTSRRFTTACGTTTCRPPRTCSTSPSTAGRSRRWPRSASRGSCTSSTGSPASPYGPSRKLPVATDTDLEGEVMSPTQPFPTRPAAFEYQGTSIDDLVDFTPEIRQMAVDAVEGFRLGPL